MNNEAQMRQKTLSWEKKMDARFGAGVIPRQLVPRATFHRQALPRPVKI